MSASTRPASVMSKKRSAERSACGVTRERRRRGLYRSGSHAVSHPHLMTLSDDELRREVRDTLMHEVGHLNGEDDEQLRDRGL